jgi:uncharacterized iron-regulated membrane protein
MAAIRQGQVGTIGEVARAVYLHPETGEVLKVYDYSRSVWRWLQLLHFNLVSGRQGRVANAWLAVASLFAMVTGLLVWWPSTLSRGVSRYRAPIGSWRMLWELHQVLGLWLMPFALVMCLTGAYFAWRAPFHEAISAVVPMRFMNQPLQPIEPVAATHIVHLRRSCRRSAPWFPAMRSRA